MTMQKVSNLRDWLVAITVAIITIAILSGYLLIRRGYFFDGPSTVDMWYVPNKALAGAGILMIAFTFLMGPLTRYFDKFDSWIGYRKEIGIVGGLVALSHGVVSYFLLPKKFPFEKMFDGSLNAFAWGLIAVAALLFIYSSSLLKAAKAIGNGLWWFMQRWGLRLVIIFTVLHVGIMKWSGWVKWFLEPGKSSAELANPHMPGAGILVSLFVAWVIIVRLYESMFLFRSFGFATKEISTNPVLKQRGRLFFLVSFWIMMMIYVVLMTRWTLI